MQFIKKDLHSKTALVSSMELFIQSANQELIKELFTMDIKVHALKFQSVVTPNGMIANLNGPVGDYKMHTFLFIVSASYMQYIIHHIYTTPHHTTPHHYTTLHYCTLYYTVLYCTVLYCTVLYYTILYYTITTDLLS